MFANLLIQKGFSAVQTELWTRTKLGIRDQQTEKSNKAINSALRANNINQTVALRAARPLRAARREAVGKLSACHTSYCRRGGTPALQIKPIGFKYYTGFYPRCRIFTRQKAWKVVFKFSESVPFVPLGIKPTITEKNIHSQRIKTFMISDIKKICHKTAKLHT